MATDTTAGANLRPEGDVLSRTEAAGLVIALIAVALNLRPAIASIGPVLPEMRGDLELTFAGASLLTSLPALCMGVFALPAPFIAERLGRDRAILAAILLVALATALRAFAAGPVQLLASTLAIGVGIGIAGALGGGFVKAHFGLRPTFYMGIYAASLSLGATIAAGTAAPLSLLTGSWRIAIGAWAVPAFLGAIVWMMAISLSTGRRGTRHSRPSNLPKIARLPWREPRAALVGVLFALQNAIFYSVIAWLAPYLAEAGVSNVLVGGYLSVLTAIFMLANVAIGAVAERSQDRRGLLAISSIFAAIGLVILGWSPLTVPIVAIGAAATGLAGVFTLGMTLPLDDARDKRDASARTAMTLMTGYILGSTGPLLTGWLREVYDSHHLGFFVLAIFALVMLAISPSNKGDALRQ